MKQIRWFDFATALLCITSLLITAFIVLLGHSGNTPNDESKENTKGGFTMASELKNQIQKP